MNIGQRTIARHRDGPFGPCRSGHEKIPLTLLWRMNDLEYSLALAPRSGVFYVQQASDAP